MFGNTFLDVLCLVSCIGALFVTSIFFTAVRFVEGTITKAAIVAGLYVISDRLRRKKE